MIIDKINNLGINILVLFFVSMLIIYMQQGEINRDGILYLTQSQFIIEGNWYKALSLYNWPFFSILIAGTHHLTGLSLQMASHLINIFLFLLAGFFFLKNVNLVSQSKIPFIFGTIILLTSIPIMDDYLAMVLRDHGHWAGFMIGVYGYLRWIKSSHWKWSILWQSGFIFGTLFRPECLVFNLLLPFTHQLFLAKKDRLNQFIQSISLPIIFGLCLLVFWIIFNINLRWVDLSRINQIIIRPLDFIANIRQPIPINTDDYFLKVLITDYAISFKYLFLSYVVLYKWVAGIGLLHLTFFIYSIKKKLIISRYLRALFIFFAISSTITIINMYSTFVVALRYWVINFWIVYIFAAIGLGHFWQTLQKSTHPKKEWLRGGLIVLLLVYFTNVLIDKPEVHFEKEAGLWVRNNQISINNIYFSSQRAAYYSGFIGYDLVDFEVAKNIIKYQYLIITYNRFSEIDEILNYKPIKYFPSQEKSKVIIYERIIE